MEVCWGFFESPHVHTWLVSLVDLDLVWGAESATLVYSDGDEG